MVTANDDVKNRLPDRLAGRAAGGGPRAGRRAGRPARPGRPAGGRCRSTPGGNRSSRPARFWSSLFHRFGISENIFRYFRHDEVFARIVERQPRRPPAAVRRAGRRQAPATARLLQPQAGRSSPTTRRRPSLLTKHHGDEGGPDLPRRPADQHPHAQERRAGVRHRPRPVPQPVRRRGPRRRVRPAPDLPVPAPPGVQQRGRRLRPQLPLRRPHRRRHRLHLDRALGQFDHDEGFTALRQRFESAQKSWASLHEAMLLHRTLAASAPEPASTTSNSTRCAATSTPSTAWPTSTASRPSGSASCRQVPRLRSDQLRQ